MGLFWRRKKDDFVSLRLNEPSEAKPEPQATQQTPAPPPPPVETPIQPRVEPPQPRVESPRETVKPEPVPSRSTFSSSILGLDRSIEELQVQEAALEQEF